MNNKHLNFLAKGFYWCLSASLAFHVFFIFYDSIKLELTFEFSPEQKEKIQKIEINTKKIERTMHRKEDKEMLVEHFKEEKKDFVAQAKKVFMSKEKDSQTEKIKVKAK